jgi:hypothetical protein
MLAGKVQSGSEWRIMRLSRTAWIAISLSALAATAARAFEVTGTAPKVHFNGVNNSAFNSTMRAYFETKMNGEVETAFNATLVDANTKMKGFKSQKDLAQAMANANVYSANSATLQGYQNYSLFAVSTGFMLAVQAPSLDPTAYESMPDDVKKKGDIYLGVGAGFSYLNVGINCGKFLLPNLYLNLKYGGMSLDLKDVSLDFKVMGVGASYAILQPKSFIGLVKWRGVSASTGFYMQMDKINMTIEPDTFKTEAHFRDAVLAGASGNDATEKAAILNEMGYGPENPDAEVAIAPVFNMGLDVSTYTIPLEVNTAVALLWGVININAGVGVDLNFGNAKVVLKGSSDADIEETDKVKFDPAQVAVDGGSSNGPSFVRPRVMTGVGLGLGPVKIDVPLLYYFNSGLAIGITGAVVW